MQKHTSVSYFKPEYLKKATRRLFFKKTMIQAFLQLKISQILI